MDDTDIETYHRSWDAFIDAYAALMERNKQLVDWGQRAAARLAKKQTQVDKELAKEWKVNGESWSRSGSGNEDRVGP
jgi:hypothetical protein